MALGKQLVLYAVFLSACSSSSICMNIQELENHGYVEYGVTEQKLAINSL